MNAACKKWDIFELAIEGPREGNPFAEQWIRGSFKGKNETVCCDGFYDGDGIYKVRFMPSFEGTYFYQIESSFGSKEEGSFEVTAPKEQNHGPVRVCSQFHFSYEDGTPYYPMGTTCYVWELQEEALQKKTLESLSSSPFNKIRFCVLPKHYDYNLGEPLFYPYEGTPMDSSVLTKENFMEYVGAAKGNQWDFSRFNTAYFRHVEESIAALGKMGVEADLILFHPYDRWGFSCMTREQDLHYLNYVLARFSAYHNVWWSLANEYDFLRAKDIGDWEFIAKTIVEKDPYHHLRSIHNGLKVYDFTHAWVTHCSLQRVDLHKTSELAADYRTRYGKPVVLDEICYEGNIQHGWGNISGKELTRRFWEAVCRGGYATHGETFLDKEDKLWWAHGGKLKGESPARIAFLRKLLEETPEYGLKPYEGAAWDDAAAVPEKENKEQQYFLFYYGFQRPSFREFYFNDTVSYEAEVIDTWEMTIEKQGPFKGKFRVELPGKEYMAVRILGISCRAE